METNDLLVDDVWESALRSLPEGYAEAACEHKALQRRRQIKSAADLLRLVLAYTLGDLSLRAAAVWAESDGVASMSSVAVLKRLRQACSWMCWLVMQMVLAGAESCCPVARAVRIVDATVVSEPGSKGTCWRLHLGLDLMRRTISSLELTGAEGGETFRRYAVQAGELLVGDRGYAHRGGVAYVLDALGHVLVRLNWQNYPLEDSDGNRIDILALVRSLPVGGTGDYDLWFRFGEHRYRARLLAHRVTAEPTAERVRELKQRARAKKRQVDPRTLEASCFVLLLTDLPVEELPADQALELYRLRWQVELVFKRLKSLLDLDALRAHDPELVTTYVMGKLLGALLLEGIEQVVERALSPPQEEPRPDGTEDAAHELVDGVECASAILEGGSIPGDEPGCSGRIDASEFAEPARRPASPMPSSHP